MGLTSSKAARSPIGVPGLLVRQVANEVLDTQCRLVPLDGLLVRPRELSSHERQVPNRCAHAVVVGGLEALGNSSMDQALEHVPYQVLGSAHVFLSEELAVCRCLGTLVQNDHLADGLDSVLGEVGMLTSHERLAHPNRVGAYTHLVALAALHGRLLLADVLEDILHLSQDLDLVLLVGLGAGLGQGGHGSRLDSVLDSCELGRLDGLEQLVRLSHA